VGVKVARSAGPGLARPRKAFRVESGTEGPLGAGVRCCCTIGVREGCPGPVQGAELGLQAVDGRESAPVGWLKEMEGRKTGGV